MKKALVIDASRTIRMILGRTLGELGFETATAANGREALDSLTPDLSLVLVDWNMPEMNGLEFVRRMRANPVWAAVPVIMVTTETRIGQMTAALEAGANEYVMKPFTAEVIEDKLRLLGLLAA